VNLKKKTTTTWRHDIPLEGPCNETGLEGIK
jgi:hypothetical protein